MAIPDFQTLMRPVLAAAATAPVRMPDVASTLADMFKLDADEREELIPSGRQRLFYNRLAWAKFHLTKAGMLESPSRGRLSPPPTAGRCSTAYPTALT
ncbi:winged helix-turn-helix domain-containing protein [Sphingomonas sp.]|uniref:winged helix-turn-helix domain-containing protein n=1 Tax=Sphingomonas sp. TaxID=28214 RepID=UPI003CC65B6C